MQCITSAEKLYTSAKTDAANAVRVDEEALKASETTGAHIDLAAG